ncbi:MAG: PEP-CTERM sorting domain-containing protein [Nitrospiraceae bacterium]
MKTVLLALLSLAVLLNLMPTRVEASDLKVAKIALRAVDKQTFQAAKQEFQAAKQEFQGEKQEFKVAKDQLKGVDKPAFQAAKQDFQTAKQEFKAAKQEFLTIKQEYREYKNGTVPIPGTFLLFGAGFAGFVAWRLRDSRRSKNHP